MGYAFVSYSTRNQQAADAMRNLLKKEGIETWMAPGDIPAGSRYAQVINQAIKGCACFILILSEDSQNSIWVAKEVERAVNYRKLIIPVQIEDLILNDEFELYLSSDQLVAIQKIDEDSDEVRKLLSSVTAVTGTARTQKRERKDSSDVKVKVMGVGGCGVNTVKRLMAERSEGIEYIAVNSDLQSINSFEADLNIYTPKEADIRSGKIAAAIEGTDLLFITAGMGGFTGSFFSGAIAELAREMGILTVGVVTMPFRFEGRSRQEKADAGLERLAEAVDTLVVIHNEKLLSIAGKTTTMSEAFKIADKTISQAIKGISELIYKPGIVRVEYDDLYRILKDKGLAYIGVGTASGAGCMTAAADEAINNPLLETGISGAASVLVNITGSSKMQISEVTEASDMIAEAAGPDADTLFGTAVDETMEDSVRIIIIATGI